MDEDYDVNVLDSSPYTSSSGVIGSMADSASQFGDTAGAVYGMANAYAQSKGGWGNTIEDAAQGYVDNHGGIAGTSAHLGHEALNVAANTLWGAKDWGKAYRAAKAGNWSDAAESAAWGLAAAGATAAMVVPGAGAGVKAAELGAQAARVGVKTGAELAAKEGGEVLAKDAVETGVREGVESSVDDVAEEVGSSASKKLRRGERKAHLAHELSGLNLPNLDINVGAGQQQTFTRAY
jgi:hypothetical protein